MDVGVLEAKNRLSELIERAERGENVVITRHGKPAARLVAARPVHDPVKARAAMDRMAERRKEIRALNATPITPAEIKEWINEGRK